MQNGLGGPKISTEKHKFSFWNVVSFLSQKSEHQEVGTGQICTTTPLVDEGNHRDVRAGNDLMHKNVQNNSV